MRSGFIETTLGVPECVIGRSDIAVQHFAERIPLGGSPAGRCAEVVVFLASMPPGSQWCSLVDRRRTDAQSFF